MSLLKKLSQELLLNEVISGSIRDKKPGHIHWKVLVLDHFSSKIVSSSCTMHGIVTAGVTIVEDLHKNREPLPYLEAIYTLKPTDDSMHCLLGDLNTNPPIYKAFHVFFIEICDTEKFDKLTQVLNIRRIKTLKEINLSFTAFDSHVFTLGENMSDRLYFNPDTSDSGKTEIEGLAEQIANLCACLGENPAIRYRSAFPKNLDLALAVVEKLRGYKTVEPSLGVGAHKARSQLIILDRGFDCVSPLLHELTFEAMTHDLLAIKDNSYKLKGNNGVEKEVFFDDSDGVWNNLKHRHIAEVITTILQEYKDFLQSINANIKELKEGLVEITNLQMQLMLKKLPQYQRQLTMFSTYINMAGDCLEAFKRIENLCALEQDLATGCDADGEIIKDFMNQMNPILLDFDRQIRFTDSEKLGIIILYIIRKNGISEESLTKLLSHARVKLDLKKVVTNLAFLGHNVIFHEETQKDIPKFKRKGTDNENRYKLSRWTPIIKDVMDFVIEGRLDEKQFPYTSRRTPEMGYKVAKKFIGFPSLKSTATRWVPKNAKADKKDVPRLIVFVVGGMTYSEIRSLYEVNKEQEGWEVIIGSNKIFTPDNFLKHLETMSV